jgi:hypothetical protein
MGEFVLSTAMLISIFCVVIVLISLKYARTGIEKLYIIFLSLFTLIYSGLGIAFETVNDKYILSFFLFLLFIIIGLNLGFRVFNIRTELKLITSLSNHNSILIKLCTFTYWGIIIFRLIYPVNKISSLLNLSISVTDVFINQIGARTNMTTYLLGIILLVIRPLYYIYLFRMKSKILPSILIFLELYISIAVNGYMGRSGMIVNGLLILFIYIYKNESYEWSYTVREKLRMRFVFSKKKIKVVIPKLKFKNRVIYNVLDQSVYKKSMKIFILMACVLMLIMPLLFDFQNYRLGAEISDANAVSKVNSLLEIELGFPKLYDEAEQLSEDVLFPEYFKWLFTLVIPKQILPVSNILLINYELSSYIHGIEYGQPGFYVYLPSILGEGIMLYGWTFSFVHGLVLGFIAGLFCSFYQKSKALSLWNIFILFQLPLMPRGGSQGTISMFINASIILVLFYILEVFRVRNSKRDLIVNDRSVEV